MKQFLRLHKDRFRSRRFSLFFSLSVSSVLLLILIALSKIPQANYFLYQLFYQPSELFDKWYIHLLIPLVGLAGLLIYLYIDYRQHLMPLRLELPDVRYTPLHHAVVVVMPRARHTWRDSMYWLGYGMVSMVLVITATSFGAANFVQAAPGSLTVTINQKTDTADPNPSYTSVFTAVFSEPIDKASLTNIRH